MVAFICCKKKFLKLKLDKFDLIIDCQSKLRNTIILKHDTIKSFLFVYF